MEILDLQLYRDSDESLHWPKSDLNKQVTHQRNTLLSFPIIFPPGHSDAYCLLSANQGATQLGFQNRSFILKNLCLQGGRDSSKGKGWMKHLLSYLRPLRVASHAALALREGVLGVTTCGSPKLHQRKKGVSCSLFHFSADTPSLTQVLRAILAAHGSLRLETSVHQPPLDWQMFTPTWFRWQNITPTFRITFRASGLCKRFSLTSLKHFGKPLCQCLCLAC